MDRQGVTDLCRGCPSAVEEFPFGPGVSVFKVGGKIFSIVSSDGPGATVSLKCDPQYAIALREEYSAVTAGYHLDKRHWNTVVLDGSVPDEIVREWILESYALVRASLTRARRAALG